MVDRNEFIKYWQRMDSPKHGYLFLGIYIGGMLLFLPFLPEGKELSAETPLLMGLFLLHTLGMPFVWFGFLIGWKTKKQFHKCPYCNRTLGGMNRYTVVATGKCGSCGNQVFEKSGSQ